MLPDIVKCSQKCRRGFIINTTQFFQCFMVPRFKICNCSKFLIKLIRQEKGSEQLFLKIENVHKENKGERNLAKAAKLWLNDFWAALSITAKKVDSVAKLLSFCLNPRNISVTSFDSVLLRNARSTSATNSFSSMKDKS